MKELQKYRCGIADKLRTVVPLLMDRIENFGGITPVLRDRLLDYVLGGKLIRGCLVPFVYDLASGAHRNDEDVMALGAIMELLQSMLLIHDDIIDNDYLRRGKAAMHALFEQDAKAFPHMKHYGVSMGICAGDVTAFGAFSMLSELESVVDILPELLSHIANEMMLVGAAQMKDIRDGYLPPGETSFEQVVTTYRCKTGRYTFSLPISLGARLGGFDPATILRLEELGELMGIIFQIKDDEIDLFGDEEGKRKPRASDIAEGKKTVYTQLLFSRLSGKEKKMLERILNDFKGTEDISWVREKIEERGIAKLLQEYLHKLVVQCKHIISQLQNRFPELAAGMEKLLEFNIDRNY